MCDPVVTPIVAGEMLAGEALLGEIAAPMFIDALGAGEALAGLGTLEVGGGLVAAPILAGEAAAGMGAMDTLGWGGMLEGTTGLDALGSITGAGMSSASSLPSWIQSAGMPIGGDLASITGAGFVPGLPEASMIPEMMTSIPGAYAPETLTSGAMLPGPYVPEAGSMWENISTPFKTANRIMEQALATPAAKGINTAGRLYSAASGLNNMLNPPERPRTVSGLQPMQQQPQQRGQWNPAFGRPLSNSIRGA